MLVKATMLSLFMVLPLPLLMPNLGAVPIPSFVIATALAIESSRLYEGDSTKRLMPTENPRATQEQMVFMINSKNTAFELMKRSVNAANPVAINQSHLKNESILLEKPLVRRQIKLER
ncbi:MAG: hypothetical protein WCG06_06765 [Candidatus Omnitrophota bacterium]